MDNNGCNQTKVVRYSGSREKQSIQWDDQSQPLYSSGSTYKYFSEKKNLCVGDSVASAVVVVSAAGNRFRYTGPSFTTKEPFIATNSQGEISLQIARVNLATNSQVEIFAAECYKCRIHILSQDGHLKFVAELRNKVKVISSYKWSYIYAYIQWFQK